MLKFTRMFVAIVNRFTLILATAGLLVALFAISGNQSDTVSARTVVIPESSGTSTTATPEAPEVRIEYIGGRVRSITEGNSITPRVALTGDSINGLEQDLVVNFAITDGATASQSDYNYPSSVTIPAGATSAPFTLSALGDDLIEYNETFNIYISSLDYNGENYDTEHAGVEFTIKSPDRIWKTIEKLPSSSWIEGGTANIRVGLTDRLPSDVPANSLFLTIGDGYDDIDITEQLKSSTEVELSIPLNDNSLRATNEQLRVGLQFQKSQIPFLSRGGVVRINIADDEEPPQVVVRRNSHGRTSTISEGGRVQLTALAPGVAPVDLVVSLAAGMSTTLASSDYDFPASVTIPKGQRSVRFWVDTSDDEQAEYADILNIRPTSVVYGSHTHPLSDTGVDLTVNSSDRIGAAVDILGPDRLNEGDTVYIRITVDELLPPETPDGSIYLVLGRRNQASDNSIIADEDDTAGLPVNIVAALKIATSTVVPVELTDDSLIELNERVFVTLAYDRQQVPFFRGRISGRFIVLDNDQTSFSIAPLSRVVYRENEAIELTVELPDGVTSTLDIQIRYRIKLRLRDADGRRVNTVNRDDIAGFLTGTVIIPAGETSAMFRIELTEDQLVEETELLGIRLQRPRVIREDGRTRGLRNAVTSEITVVSVIDNDRPTIRIRPLRRTELVEVSDTSTSTTVTEGDSIRLVAEITNAPNGAAAATALNLGANTAGTTAYADDYWFPATVTIPTGSVRAVFTVNTFDDDVVEGDETLNIYVAGVTYGDDSYSPPDSGFNLTIVDDDEPPVVKVRSLRNAWNSPLPTGVVAEGDTVQLEVELTNAPEGGANQDITVHLATGSGTTAYESDYNYPSSVTIPRGQSRVEFKVSTVDDDHWDEDGSRSLRIYPSSVDYLGRNYEQSNSGAILTIRDNDEEWHVHIRTVQDTPTTPLYNTLYRRISEGESALLKVELRDISENVLGGGFEETVTVNLRFLNHGREADASDYSFPRVITIPPGQIEMEFEVKTFLDDLVEGYEWVYIGISNVEYGGRTYRRHPTTGYEAGVVIYDNDRWAPLEIVPVSSGTIDEGESAWLAVNLTNPPEGGAEETITVHLATWRDTTMASESDYSYPSSVTIPRGQSRVEFEVSATEDSLVEDNETFQIYIAKVARGNRIFYSTTFPPASVTIVDNSESPVVVPPVTATTISATLSRSSLTLQEGRAATITVDLSGDLSSLVDGDTSVLTIEARPVEGEETGLIRGTSDIYLPAELNDYELTPVTIDKQAGQATFEVRAVDDNDYDPLESVMLELVSGSDDIEIGSPNSLKLKIGDNDPRPFVSFTTTLTTARYFDGTSLIKLSEGDKGTFRVVLDRKSNRAVGLYVYSQESPIRFLNGGGFFDANGVDPIQTLDNALWRYISDQGFWTYNEAVLQSDPLIIPAGELGLTFIADTTALANDLYDYIEEDYFGTVLIYMKQSAYAYTDYVSGLVHFRVLQDEPTPELSFRSADDGDATITVREGESFEVGIDIYPELGRYHRVWNSLLPGISLASQLTATAVTGEVPDWELPEIEIVPGQPGVTVTVQVPADSLANGERTVVLDFEDALLSYTRSHLTVPPRIKNSLVVTILDAEPLTAQLNTSELTLQEGRAATITIDLSGDLSSLVDGDTSVLTIEARPVEGEETGLIRGTSDIYLPAELNDYELTPVTIDKQAGQATFEVRAVDDNDYDPLESVMLELVSGSDDVQVVSPNSLKLKIGDNDPRPFISFTTTLTTGRYFDGTSLIKLSEGDKGTFRVVLDRKSNRSVEVYIYSDGDFRPFFDANGVDPIRYARTHVGRRYFEDMGFWPGNRSWDDVIGPGPLVIPAGELGLTFTVDTTLLENDLYDYIDEDYFGTVYLKMNHPVYAYTDEASSRVHFRVLQDEPTPELSFRSADDGDATITVREGESFDVKIDIDPELGRYHRVWNSLLPGISLASQLTATAVTGEVPAWELPDVEIVPGQPGVTVTVQIPADSLANGERTVVLDFEDALLSYTRSHLTVPPRIKNSLVVTILDAEPPVVVPPSQPPVVRVRAVSGTVLVEGSSVLLAVELTNAPEGGSAETITVHLDTGSGTTLTRHDYRDTNYPSSVTIPQGQNRVEFNIKVRRNALTQDSDVINLYVSSVDYGGENYEQSDLGVDLTITDYIAMPIVTILDHRNPLYADRIHTVNEGPYSARLYVKAQIPSTYVYESFYSVPRDVVVHLAARNITTSDSDYSFPSSVTVRRGRTGVDVLVKALDDDLVEFGETFEIYVASVEYRGKTFELSDAGVRLTIDNYDDVIQTSIKVPGGVDQLEGTTVTVQVELSEELPANIPANSVKLAFTPRDDARTVGQLPYVVDITEDLRGSTVVDVPFFLAADYLQEQADLVDLSVVISDDELRQLMSGSQSYFRIVADDGQNYEQPDTGADLTIIDNENPPIVTIRQVWPGLLYEDEFGWRTTPRWSDSELWRRATVFEAVLTNAPSGGTAETITVHLETGDSTTASESDYSYPDIVTIPPGESVVRFTIRARSDWQREYRETLNVYVSSVDYLGQNYVQSDSGVDLNIIGDDKIRPYVTVLGGDVHLEGSTVTVQIELSEVLPARIPAGSVKLAISLTGATRSVAMDGQSHIFEGSEPFVIDITEDLKNSTLVELSFHLIDNHSLEQTSLMKIEWIVAREESIPFSPLQGNSFNPILLENTWPFSFSIVDDDGPDPDNDGLDIDNDLAPIITFLPRYPRSVAHRTVYEGRRSGDPFWVSEKSFWVELTDTSPGGAAHDITVHLATQSGATASEFDYSYPSSVTIPRGQRRVMVSVRAVDDDELEQNEHFTIYASSIDYRGRSYEQSYANIKWWIRSDEEIHGSITPLSGVDQVKGRTVTVRIEISEVPPPDVGNGSARLSFLLSGSTRAVDATVGGKPYILGTNEFWWTSLSLPWEHFRNSTTLDIPFYLADDGLPEEPELTLLMKYNASFWGFDSTGIHPETEGFFRVIDNDDLPLVSVRSLRSDTSTPLTSTSSVRRSDLNSVNEGDTVQLVAELTNAPEGGAAQDITVNLATGNGATASESDYSYPSSVTIPQGQSRVTFEISALQDDLVEDDETLNIYASSVDLAGHNYEQSDTGVDLTIVDDDEPPIVVVQRFWQIVLNEGETKKTHVTRLMAKLINAPEGGTVEDITVHLASGDSSTASESDYSYPRTVTIPQGESQANFWISPFLDGLAEYREILNIYVSSVDYLGQNYEQSDSGVDIDIISVKRAGDVYRPPDNIRPDITVLGGVDHQVGTTVTVRVEISEVLPARILADSVRLAASITGSATSNARSVSVVVDGQSVVLKDGEDLFDLDITEDLKNSTQVDIPIYLADDDLRGQTGLVHLKLLIAREERIPSPLGGHTDPILLAKPSPVFFRVIDDDEPPVVSIRSLRRAEPAEVSEVEVPDLNEGDTVQLVAELTNAPEGGAAQDITVNLATGNGATASASDYSYPSSVTIPQGQSRVIFEVSASQDDLVEDDETLNIYASSVDLAGHNYEQSDTGADLTIVDVDNNVPPVVEVRFTSSPHYVGSIPWRTIYEGRQATLLAVELTNAPEGGAAQDITVHLATGSSSEASRSDYSYPDSVVIPRGESRATFEVIGIADDLAEYDEILNIYVSSVDYGGRNYEQSDAGVDLTIYNFDIIQASITVLGGVDHLEGTTVTVRVELNYLLPENAPANTFVLSFLMTGSALTVGGQPYVVDIDITEELRDSTIVDVPFYLMDDHLIEPNEIVYLSTEISDPLSLVTNGDQSFFWVIDNDEPPVVVVPDPIVTVRSLSGAEGGVEVPDLSEGDTVQLVAELTNAPEGGATQDITVNLATGNGATASESDYSYPSSVTIPQGQSRVTFEVSASQDDLVEDDETLNIYVNSVDYNGYNYGQSDAGADLTIVDVDNNEPPVVSIRSLRRAEPAEVSGVEVSEGDTLTLEVELTNAPEDGAAQDITVNLATGSGDRLRPTTATRAALRYRSPEPGDI